MDSLKPEQIEKINFQLSAINLNWNRDEFFADMTPVAANAWVKVAEAKRDAVALPSKYDCVKSVVTNTLVVGALIVLGCLACFSDVGDAEARVLIAIAAALGGAWCVTTAIKAWKKSDK
jgi:hypothetical protein